MSNDRTNLRMEADERERAAARQVGRTGTSIVSPRKEGPTVEESMSAILQQLAAKDDTIPVAVHSDRVVDLISDMIDEKVEAAVEQAIEMHKDAYNHDLMYE